MLKNISYLLLVIVVISMFVLSACSPKSTDVEKLTDVEKEGIQYIYEVEKVARDVYQYFYDKWGTPVQDVISGSEQSHMDIMKELIDEYNLDDPAEGNDYGEFSNSDLQQLYHDLIESGLSSEVNALSTAATIEEYDIVEIRKYLSNTDRDDIISGYNKLIEGSESHLRIFVTKLKDEAVDYQPQYLSQQDYNQIIVTVTTEIPTTTAISTPTGTPFSELAVNGKQSYSDNCFNCHGEHISTGSYFTLSGYQNAQKLLEKISTMPNSGEQDQWEVLSYILLEHGWVSGTEIFNVDTLSQISLPPQ